MSEDNPAGQSTPVALVTGACGGIGSAVSRLLASQGWCVVLIGRSPRKLDRLCDQIEQAGGEPPLIYPMNLEGATPDDYAELNNRLAEEFGKLDALVHCAAAFQGLKPLLQTPADQWLRILHVNLSAPIFLTIALQPTLASAPAGRVLFTIDDTGRTSRAYWGGYGASKAGLAGAADILAAEWESSTISVQKIVPPPTATRLRASAYPGERAESLMDPDEVAKLYAAALAESGDG